MRDWLPYPYAEIGTPAAVLVAVAIYYLGRKIIQRREANAREFYRKRQALKTIILVLVALIVVLLWARTLQHTGTFLGLLGGGLAIALREPLLAIAGRIAILAGHIYTVGDRVQLEQTTGDIIDVGFFYTRMMELGSWIGGDQATGRIVQFSNSKIFGSTMVYNYTRNFSYIWDELMLPVTYDSNIQAATQILLDAGNQYTREFLEGAQQQLEKMRHYFLVPSFELKPQVYLKVTSNWVQLSLRYVVEPKQRRSASHFIWQKAFDNLQSRNDVTIASETSDIAIHWRDQNQGSSSSAEMGRRAAG
jgi:small-conductance mechanosensitive channel